MYRAAEAFALKNGCSAIVTGESLGQVSSQTLRSIAVLSQSVKIPVIRPVFGLDKHEITRIAIKAGTYETSKGAELCDTLGPRHPNTRPVLEKIIGAERELGIESELSNFKTE